MKGRGTQNLLQIEIHLTLSNWWHNHTKGKKSNPRPQFRPYALSWIYCELVKNTNKSEPLVRSGTVVVIWEYVECIKWLQMSTVLTLVGSKLSVWERETKYGVRGGKEEPCGTG